MCIHIIKVLSRRKIAIMANQDSGSVTLLRPLTKGSPAVSTPQGPSVADQNRSAKIKASPVVCVRGIGVSGCRNGEGRQPSALALCDFLTAPFPHSTSERPEGRRGLAIVALGVPR